VNIEDHYVIRKGKARRPGESIYLSALEVSRYAPEVRERTGKRTHLCPVFTKKEPPLRLSFHRAADLVEEFAGWSGVTLYIVEAPPPRMLMTDVVNATRRDLGLPPIGDNP
jgi:hypothetical protein